jgi:carbon-monoxide dehydrogenase small subunit
MKVNGVSFVPERGDQRLLDFLREDLGLTGAKEGCGMGECGACTVIVNDKPVCSCLVLVAQLEHADVVTVEGIVSHDGGLHPVQQALVDYQGSQCGYCTPGIVISAAALLATNPHPSLDEIREALAGNLCRCTGYGHIFSAVRAAMSS